MNGRRIFKYRLAVTDEQDIAMPAGAQVLAVQVQHGAPQLWALVDPEAQISARRFITYGTGHEVPRYSQARYVGTFQLAGGELVFHVFDDGNVISRQTAAA